MRGASRSIPREIQAREFVVKIEANSDSGIAPTARKTYSRPAIIHSEKTEARAVLCNKAPSACKGPAQS